VRVLGVLGASLALAFLTGLIAGAWGRTPAGNTALIVPFSVGPAIIAAGWAALALAEKRAAVGAAAYFVLALVLSLLTSLLPVLLLGRGGDGSVGSVALAIPVVLAVPIGGAIAVLLGFQPGRRGWLASIATCLVAVVLVLAPTGIGFALAPLLLTMVLLSPLALRHGVAAREPLHVAGAVLLPLAVALGILAGNFFVG
jgi:hypothetical protein